MEAARDRSSRAGRGLLTADRHLLGPVSTLPGRCRRPARASTSPVSRRLAHRYAARTRSRRALDGARGTPGRTRTRSVEPARTGRTSPSGDPDPARSRQRVASGVERDADPPPRPVGRRGSSDRSSSACMFPTARSTTRYATHHVASSGSMRGERTAATVSAAATPIAARTATRSQRTTPCDTTGFRSASPAKGASAAGGARPLRCACRRRARRSNRQAIAAPHGRSGDRGERGLRPSGVVRPARTGSWTRRRHRSHAAAANTTASGRQHRAGQPEEQRPSTPARAQCSPCSQSRVEGQQRERQCLGVGQLTGSVPSGAPPTPRRPASVAVRGIRVCSSRRHGDRGDERRRPGRRRLAAVATPVSGRPASPRVPANGNPRRTNAALVHRDRRRSSSCGRWCG